MADWYAQAVGGLLLVSGDWRTRALLRAQLIEEGYPVRAFESLDHAQDELGKGAFKPTLVIAELADGEPAGSDALARLSAWTRKVPVWVLASRSVDADSALEKCGFEKVIYRPFGIKELVEQIKDRLHSP